jgi:hypothetical protein
MLGKPPNSIPLGGCSPAGWDSRENWEKSHFVWTTFRGAGQEEIPIRLLEQMDLRNSLYGYIGKEDYTMFPIIRPASFVQIDRRQTKITNATWHNDHDRPIYFFELRDRYVCSWCELDGGQLILIPSPQSRLPARHVCYSSQGFLSFESINLLQAWSSNENCCKCPSGSGAR